MNQKCRVCEEPAAGFHFGAFTCEGCKSFFGRTYNNQSSISDCKNNWECVINKKNRTACKACRLRKCLEVGMSKSGSRYGRRSNWFKIHCLLQEQQHQSNVGKTNFFPSNLPTAALLEYYKSSSVKIEDDVRRQSTTPSDSGASSADPDDENNSRSTSSLSFIKPALSPNSDKELNRRKRKISNNSVCVSPFSASSSATTFPPPVPITTIRTMPPALVSETWQVRNGGDALFCSPAVAGIALDQDQPIDLSVKSATIIYRRSSNISTDSEPQLNIDLGQAESKADIKIPLDLSLVSKRKEDVPMTG